MSWSSSSSIKPCSVKPKFHYADLRLLRDVFVTNPWHPRWFVLTSPTSLSLVTDVADVPVSRRHGEVCDAIRLCQGNFSNNLDMSCRGGLKPRNFPVTRSMWLPRDKSANTSQLPHDTCHRKCHEEVGIMEYKLWADKVSTTTVIATRDVKQ